MTDGFLLYMFSERDFYPYYPRIQIVQMERVTHNWKYVSAHKCVFIFFNPWQMSSSLTIYIGSPLCDYPIPSDEDIMSLSVYLFDF